MGIQTRYDTSTVARVDRFAFWRESVCESYVRLGCDTSNRQEFQGLIEISHHSALSISTVSGLSHTVQRRSCDISASSDAYFLLSLQSAETSTVSQFGKTALLQPGDMALYSSTDPYQLCLADHFRQTVVQLPAAKLLDRLPNALMLTGHGINGQSGVGKLVRENILAFSEYIDSPNQTLQTLVQETLIDLIATGLASSQATEQIELSCPEQHAMLLAKSFIRNHLRSPKLDRNRVASEVGLSVRRLNDIFVKHGDSISSYIRKTRLQHVADDLRDVRFTRQSISEIAFRYGFSNMQNLSTVFRSVYGQSPREYRKHHFAKSVAT